MSTLRTDPIHSRKGSDTVHLKNTFLCPEGCGLFRGCDLYWPKQMKADQLLNSAFLIMDESDRCWSTKQIVTIVWFLMLDSNRTRTGKLNEMIFLKNNWISDRCQSHVMCVNRILISLNLMADLVLPVSSTSAMMPPSLDLLLTHSGCLGHLSCLMSPLSCLFGGA